ncbi:MAG TPA: hypothetical protein VNK49_07990 [Anaerolineales bacterium]|nr:hypothetical protein [Anaerolineales bacterium]
MTIKYEGTVVWPKGATERKGPGIHYDSVGVLAQNTVIQGIGLYVEEEGLKIWMQLPNGNWVAVNYPDSSGVPQVRVAYREVGAPDDVVITSVVVHYTVNGQPFSKRFTQ